MLRLCILLLSLYCFSAQASPLWVEAEGSATIINGDLGNARRSAVAQASELAALQAAAYISTTTEIQGGILQMDNLRMSSLGRLSNVEVIDERIQGTILKVRIRAEVSVDQGCPDGRAEVAYRKSLGFTAFPIQHPQQAATGALQNAATELPNLLARRLSHETGLHTILATHLSLHPNLQQAPTRQLADGTLTQATAHSETTQVHFLISGVIRDLSQANPIGPREPNVVTDLYRRLDYASQHHLRQFALDLFIHDALTGQLMFQQHYQTQGRWNAREKPLGFASAGFWQEDYGQAVERLIRQMSQEISEQLRCQAFSARITQTEGNRVWINAGSLSGLKPGDRLSVYRRQTHYDTLHQPYSELQNARVTLTLDQVEASFASGTLNTQTASSVNIQRDDWVRSH
ncbi:flagellar assembly protein T N-terminal domain-containing protein [Nitrincola tapanii]|uniref:Flagellar assembly protein T N-terminal domain-containing protein n=1 Tax=Nitrincola tapanii TaxID=1708751 RepID=A0A5A9W3G7_9GAMM|nr:flagellar assembly protein T N-terminal domain-containing protein [Nitrincola tapanii]KAA0874658.1 hypothetical protein E1H14_07455 [Nitrincola tapanii]